MGTHDNEQYYASDDYLRNEMRLLGSTLQHLLSRLMELVIFAQQKLVRVSGQAISPGSTGKSYVCLLIGFVSGAQLVAAHNVEYMALSLHLSTSCFTPRGVKNKFTRWLKCQVRSASSAGRYLHRPTC